MAYVGGATGKDILQKWNMERCFTDIFDFCPSFCLSGSQQGEHDLLTLNMMLPSWIAATRQQLARQLGLPTDTVYKITPISPAGGNKTLVAVQFTRVHFYNKAGTFAQRRGWLQPEHGRANEHGQFQPMTSSEYLYQVADCLRKKGYPIVTCGYQDPDTGGVFWVNDLRVYYYRGTGQMKISYFAEKHAEQLSSFLLGNPSVGPVDPWDGYEKNADPPQWVKDYMAPFRMEAQEDSEEEEDNNGRRGFQSHTLAPTRTEEVQREGPRYPQGTSRRVGAGRSTSRSPEYGEDSQRGRSPYRQDTSRGGGHGRGGWTYNTEERGRTGRSPSQSTKRGAASRLGKSPYPQDTSRGEGHDRGGWSSYTEERGRSVGAGRTGWSPSQSPKRGAASERGRSPYRQDTSRGDVHGRGGWSSFTEERGRSVGGGRTGRSPSQSPKRGAASERGRATSTMDTRETVQPTHQNFSRLNGRSPNSWGASRQARTGRSPYPGTCWNRMSQGLARALEVSGGKKCTAPFGVSGLGWVPKHGGHPRHGGSGGATLDAGCGTAGSGSRSWVGPPTAKTTRRTKSWSDFQDADHTPFPPDPSPEERWGTGRPENSLEEGGMGDDVSDHTVSDQDHIVWAGDNSRDPERRDPTEWRFALKEAVENNLGRSLHKHDQDEEEEPQDEEEAVLASAAASMAIGIMPTKTSSPVSLAPEPPTAPTAVPPANATPHAATVQSSAETSAESTASPSLVVPPDEDSRIPAGSRAEDTGCHMFQRWTGDWGRVKICRARHGIYEQYEVAYLESNVDELLSDPMVGERLPSLFCMADGQQHLNPAVAAKQAARMAARTSQQSPSTSTGQQGQQGQGVNRTTAEHVQVSKKYFNDFTSHGGEVWHIL